MTIAQASLSVLPCNEYFTHVAANYRNGGSILQKAEVGGAIQIDSPLPNEHSSERVIVKFSDAPQMREDKESLRVNKHSNEHRYHQTGLKTVASL